MADLPLLRFSCGKMSKDKYRNGKCK